MRTRIARHLRRLADRIDHAGAPKGLSWSFTFEDGKGIVFNQDHRGCPLWYLGDEDYRRAHAEANRDAGETPPARSALQRYAAATDPFTALMVARMEQSLGVLVRAVFGLDSR